MTSGTRTLKDATSEAIRDWVTNVETTHYILGSVAGPHPFPMMVRPLTCAPNPAWGWMGLDGVGCGGVWRGGVGARALRLTALQNDRGV